MSIDSKKFSAKIQPKGVSEEELRSREELNELTIQKILTSETSSKGGKVGGKKQYEEGIGMFARSKEERLKDSSKAGKIGGKMNVESGRIAKLNAVTQTCPTCGRVVKGYAGFHNHSKACAKNNNNNG